jgi:hypothetical protein
VCYTVFFDYQDTGWDVVDVQFSLLEAVLKNVRVDLLNRHLGFPAIAGMSRSMAQRRKRLCASCGAPQRRCCAIARDQDCPELAEIIHKQRKS